MPRIVLKDLDTEKAQSVPEADAQIGRDPSCAFVIEGAKSKVVSGRHARIFFQDNSWWIEDTSRNGTILDDERLQSGQRHAIRVGQVIGLGESGPRFRVSALETKQVMATIIEPPDLNRPVAPPPEVAPTPPDEFEAIKPTTAPRNAAPAVGPSSAAAHPDIAAGKTSAMRRSEAIRAGLQFEESTEPMSPAPDWLVHVVLRATNTNQRFDVRSMVVKLGRAPECNVQIPAEHGASVSRVHAEISVLDGGVSVKDCGSRNGTYLNGKRLEGAHVLARSDLVMLGSGGPTFSVEELHIVKGQAPQPVPTEDSTVTPAEAKKRATAASGVGGSATDPMPAQKRGSEDAKKVGPASDLRRSFAGQGRTAFFKDVLEDMSQKSAKRVRVVVWASVGTTIVVAAAILGITQWRVSESERRMEAENARIQAATDSATKSNEAKASRARATFDSALAASAPRAVIDSMRNALADATRRTGMLEQSLVRARVSLDQQLAAGDSARRRAEDDMTRLRTEVSKAQSGDGSRAALDSLRRALRGAEERANDVANQVKAVRGSNLAQVSQMNQAAVGLLFMFLDPKRERMIDGTGFVITRSGYLVTNKHNVVDDAGNQRDTIYVTMADGKFSTQTRVTVIAVSRDADLALVKIPNYAGPFMSKIDWNGVGASQGEPAALIGFPGGVSLAFDEDRSSSTIRTTMSAGIFSKVAQDRIQFDGFTVKGSSGSPIFNANGEVVAVHKQGLEGGAGMSFAVPIARVIALLPPDAKSELGLR